MWICYGGEGEGLLPSDKTPRRDGEKNDLGFGANRAEVCDELSDTVADGKGIGLETEVVRADQDGGDGGRVVGEELAHVLHAPEEILDAVAADAGVDDGEVRRHVGEARAAPVVRERVAEEDDGVRRCRGVCLFDLRMAWRASLLSPSS